MSPCNGANCQPEGHNVISSLQRLIVVKINFMLGRCFLMMRSLDFKSHILQIHYNVASGILAKIQRTDIKKSCLLLSLSGRHCIFVCIKQEEFTFRLNFQRIPKLLCLRHRALQCQPGVSFVRQSVRAINITQHAGYFSLLRSPWENFKGRQIWIQIHIRLFHAHKTAYGRPIKHAFMIQCLLDLACSNSRIFKIAKHIRKLQSDKFHILFFYQSEYVFLCVMIHPHILLTIKCASAHNY